MNIYFERLKEFWESKGYKDATKFALDIGFSRGENILRIKRSDKNEPGMLVLEKIIEKFPDFDFRYFLTGIKNQIQYNDNSEANELSETKIKYFNCPECIEKQKKLEKTEKERDDYRQKYIECLEDLAGKKKAVI